MKILHWGTALSITTILATLAVAAPPQTISYQGYLKNTDGTPVTTQKSIRFSLYSSNPARNNPVWRETQNVTPQNGVYSVSLGSVTPIATPFDIPYHLGVKVEPDSEMPLQPLTSVPYALNAPLPAATTYASSGNPFTVTNNGTGGAIKGANGNGNYATLGGQISGLEVRTTGGPGAVSGLYALSSGAVPAIYGANIGTGYAGWLKVTNASNPSPALYIENNGGSSAVSAWTTGDGTALYSQTTGNGYAGAFRIANASSSSATLLADTNGIGSAGRFFSTNANSQYSTLYSGSNGGSPALEAVQYGIGNAAIFGVSNSQNNLNTVNINGPGSATSLYAEATGTGKAAEFIIGNTASNNSAINVQTNGTGSAGRFYTTNSLATASTLLASSNGGNKAFEASQYGTGYAGYFLGNDATNGFSTVYIDSKGTGSGLTINSTGTAMGASISNNSNAQAIYASNAGAGGVINATSFGAGTTAVADFSVNNTAGGQSVLKAVTNGTGKAGEFRITNADNTSPVVLITQAGYNNALETINTSANGNAGSFKVQNGSNSSNALHAQTNGSGAAIQAISSGTGSVGLFDISNTSSPATALWVATSGTGRAGRFTLTNNSNGSTAMDVSTSGTGDAIRGTSSSGAGVRGTSSTTGPGLSGASASGVGAYGTSASNYGVYGLSTNSVGVKGESTNDTGVWGVAGAGAGVDGMSSSGLGVRGRTGDNIALYGINNSAAAPAVEGWNQGSGDIFKGWSGASGSQTLKFYVANNGNAWLAGTLTQASDLRLKTDIQPLENSLAKVMNLRGVSYAMKDDEAKARKIGVIAQELEQEYPELVSTDGQGMKSVAYANLTAVLLEAVKEQQLIIRSQNDRIHTLEERLARIESLFDGTRR